jgi:hypothetical protein
LKNKQNILRNAEKFYFFFAALESFNNFGNTHWRWKNGLIGIKSPASEPTGSDKNCKEI